jgi:hypothetical protein
MKRTASSFPSTYYGDHCSHIGCFESLGSILRIRYGRNLRGKTVSLFSLRFLKPLDVVSFSLNTIHFFGYSTYCSGLYAKICPETFLHALRSIIQTLGGNVELRHVH